MPVRAAQVLLCFTRDPVVAQRSAHPRPTPLVSRNRANQRAAFPPNEVPPGRGLADLVCPLCFVYAQPPERYDRVRLLLLACPRAVSDLPSPSLAFLRRYAQPPELYYCFRELWCRSEPHARCSDPG